MENVVNGCYRLSWRERICFCSGDLAQNLIYQTVSIWLLFYYNNIYGLDSDAVGRTWYPMARHPDSCRPVRTGYIRDRQV